MYKTQTMNINVVYTVVVLCQTSFIEAIVKHLSMNHLTIWLFLDWPMWGWESLITMKVYLY